MRHHAKQNNLNLDPKIWHERTATLTNCEANSVNAVTFENSNLLQFQLPMSVLTTEKQHTNHYIVAEFHRN